MVSDLTGDKADHTLIVTAAITDLISLLPEFDFDGDREVFLVGDGKQLLEKTTEEIAHDAEEEIAQAACLARTGKRHNDM
jgi:hypothetical protein